MLALVSFLREFRAAGYPLTTPYGIPDDRPVDPIEKQIVADELADAGIPVFAGNPVGVWAIWTFGSDEQKQRYLPQFLAMEQVWTQLFSEPDAGSDLASLRTTAVFDGDDYIVNGSKIWSSYAHLAQYGLLLARTDSSVSKHNGISAFILDMSLPGITIAPLKQMTRDEEFNQVFFDNVRVKPTERIGEEGDGWPIARASVNAERLSVGGVSRRPAMSPLPPLIELAHRKHRDGTAPADDASVRQDIARLHARAHALKCLRFVLMTRQARDTNGAGRRVGGEGDEHRTTAGGVCLRGQPVRVAGPVRRRRHHRSRRRALVAGQLLVLASVDHRRRDERDPAQSHLRARPRPAPGQFGGAGRRTVATVRPH